MNEINESKLIVSIEGKADKGMPCNAIGYGDYIYLRSHDDFIVRLVEDISMWQSKQYRTKNLSIDEFYGYDWKGYEVSCEHRDFLRSSTFKIICDRHNVELVVADNNSEGNKIRKAFFEEVIHEFKSI